LCALAENRKIFFGHKYAVFGWFNYQVLQPVVIALTALGKMRNEMSEYFGLEELMNEYLKPAPPFKINVSIGIPPFSGKKRALRPPQELPAPAK
jgi:hypothetical protein